MVLIKFEQINIRNPADFNIVLNGPNGSEIIGTYFKIMNDPKAPKAIVRDLEGNRAIVPNKQEAIVWLNKKSDGKLLEKINELMKKG